MCNCRSQPVDDPRCDVPTTTSGRQASVIRSVRRVLGLVMPGILLGLIPKCPACLAAYIALATGVTVSVSTASHLRLSLILIGGISLAIVSGCLLRRWASSRVPG